MKTKIFYMIIPFFMGGMLMTGCMEKSTRDSNENQKDKLVTDIKKQGEDIKIAINQNWEKFKESSEQALQNTEEEIETLRGKIVKSNKKQREKLNNEIDQLEKQNRELRGRIAARNETFKENMVEFNEDALESQKAFEREFKHDMDNLGKSIKDLFKNNTN